MNMIEACRQMGLPLIYPLLLFGLLAGCSTAHMPLSETLASADHMPVTGRQGLKIKEHMSFGPFEAAEIDRSWVKGGDVQIKSFESSKRSQQFTFQLRDDGVDRWFVSCEAFLRKATLSTEIVDVDIKNRSNATCYLSVKSDLSNTWTLRLNEKGDRPLAGELTSNGTNALTVSGTRKLAGGLPAESVTGYEFRFGDGVVAAVEVINQGSVWLSRHAEADRDVLAAAAAALLLLEDLRAHLPNE